MKPFLTQVAGHYYASGDIGKRCFVFPNRRSLLFFRKWLADCVVSSGKPAISPLMYTVNDFFFKLAGKRQTDRLSLLLVLYDCYKALNPKAEDLDDFIFWGEVMLSDFDDVDKYMVNPKSLFTNVAQFKEIQDSYEYLSAEQRAAVEQFVSNFNQGGDSAAGSGQKKSEIKKRFLQIWNLLLPLYESFRAELERRGICYEGMAYRELATAVCQESASDVLARSFPEGTSIVFVGLNALNECEKTVLSRMRDAGLAEFCWDYSSDMIKDPHNRSSVFMRENIQAYPQAFRIDPEGLEKPVVTVVSVPSSVGGAKQLPRILSEISPGELDTAIVLPDENLLLPVLNSIPESVTGINVTMGYPIRSSEFFELMNQISQMQLHLRQRDGKWLFYHKQVHAIFSNSAFRSMLDNGSLELVESIRRTAKYYIPQEDFAGQPLLEAIFIPVVKDMTDNSGATSQALADYLLDLSAMFGLELKKIAGMVLELDFARQYYQDMNKLRRMAFKVRAQTFVRLVNQLAFARTVPFHGEPLKGLQVMGPLETRALDFENLIVLSCNEGVFPRSSISSSFIPPELRKGFGLPTYEYQDAVWAYYFYRMIQRARRVWLIFDSRTEGLQSGEESRYIKQLELHYGIELQRMTAVAPLKVPAPVPEIEKTDATMAALEDYVFSASSIQDYLCCPVRFYYSAIEGLKEAEDVEESLDASQVGNVLHKVMQQIYTVPDRKVTAEYLEGWIRRPESVRAKIDSCILKEMKTTHMEGRNVIFSNIILKYALNILKRDCELLAGKGASCFMIRGLEHKGYVDICGRRFKGYIDRMDSIEPGTVRVVDYKSGKVSDAEMRITEENATAIARDAFDSNKKDWPKIAIQMYIYDRIVKEIYPDSRIINSLYPAVRLFVTRVPEVASPDSFIEAMDAGMKNLLEEIFDRNIPFAPTGNAVNCTYCNFKTLCGK